ncbi:MAG: glycerol-3-phosphate 1-O-acyltransferase PlsY [Bacillota bacterium]|nr:glycerol-3-phosphate 1-O-acyltransferase PlsY [Bacillota bacterium]
MSQSVFILAASIILGYLLGSIPTGVLVSRWGYGLDLRRAGSGNIGATNALRVLGPGPALLVLLVDVAKGTLSVWLARLLGGGLTAQVLAGMAAVIGHNWSLYLGLQGGRGIATTLGVLLVLMPQVVAVLAVIWAFVVALTRYVSLGSILAAVAFPFVVWATRLPSLYLSVSVVLSAAVIYKHLPNLRRLLQGTEHKLGQKSKREG